MKKKSVIRIIKWVVMVYCLSGIALYYFQNKLIFHPQTIAISDSFRIDRPFKEINLDYDPQSNLSIIKFELPREKRKGAVLYFHGNMNNVEYYAPLTYEFVDRGYEAWLMDYPGYGKSTGEMSEKRFYEYAIQMYKLANADISADSIILYGKSIGTGIAAYVASKHSAKQLILETPYYSLTSLAFSRFPIYPTKMMMEFKIPTYQFLEKITIPVLIFHGTADGTIPFSNAMKLKKFLKPRDEFIVIKDGKHNGLQKDSAYQAKLNAVLN